MAEEVRAHITGVVFQIVAGVGEKVGAGAPILILESMKMEIPVEAPRAGVVRELRVAEGQTVQEGEVVATLD
jgi:biotin carboxyl carrier protein